VTIRASDQGFSFPTDGQVSTWESSSEVQIPVNRGSDVAGEISVDYTVVPGTATPGEDYVPVSGTIKFGAGEDQKFVSIPLLKDGRNEGNEDFRVILSNPSAGAVLGSRASTRVTIHDDDLGFGFNGGGCAFESGGACKVAVMIFSDMSPAVPYLWTS
jgi:hypothetical protein